MAIQVECEKCGARYRASEEHRCARLDLARKVLSEASERVGAPPSPRRPPTAAPSSGFPSGGRNEYTGRFRVDPAKAKEPGFDRNAYHKAYMRAYMRRWRARRKADESAEKSD
jgi:hypothetical protein